MKNKNKEKLIGFTGIGFAIAAVWLGFIYFQLPPEFIVPSIVFMLGWELTMIANSYRYADEWNDVLA